MNQSYSQLRYVLPLDAMDVIPKLSINEMEQVPDDIRKIIVEYVSLNIRDLVAVSGTCKAYWNLIENAEPLWKKLYFYYYFGRQLDAEKSSKQNFMENCKFVNFKEELGYPMDAIFTRDHGGNNKL